MELKGSFAVPVAAARVWDSLWHESTLPVWIPGCTQVRITPDRKITATVEQQVAFLKSRFDLEITVEQAEAPQRLVLAGGGKDARLGSQVKLTLELRLQPAGDNATQVTYRAEAVFYGRIATIGQFAIQAKARTMETELARRVTELFATAAD